jgi:tetratricopeptide (TPR) repeat protein
MLWLQLTAGAQLDLARALLVLRKADEAAVQTRAACELVERLAGRDVSAVERRSLQIECLGQRARVALETGAHGEALGLAQRALAAAQGNHSADQVDDRFAIAGAYKLLGDNYSRSRDGPAARSAFEAALAAWPRGITETPRQTAIRASILAGLGRSAEARPLNDRLEAIGYRRLI